MCILLGYVAYREKNLSYEDYMARGQKESATEKEDSDTPAPIYPEHYFEEVNPYLLFDAAVATNPQFNPNEIYDTSATVKNNDGPIMCEKLMQKSGEMETEIFEDVDWNGNTVSAYTFETEEDYLLVRPNYLGYGKGELTYALEEVFCFSEVSPIDNRDDFFLAADFTDFSKDEAWTCVTEALQDEIPDIDYYFSFPVRAEVLNEQLAELKSIMDDYDTYYEEFTEKEEGYFFYCAQVVDGICVYQENYLDSYSPREDRPKFTIMVTRDGIAMVTMFTIFSFEQSENKITLCDFSQIVDVAKTHYVTVANENMPLVVSKFELLYFPLNVGNGQYRLVPIWVVTAEYDWRTGGNTVKDVIAINAQTGEEMPELFLY